MVSNANPAPRHIINVEEPRRHVLIVDDHVLLAQSLAQILTESGLPASVSTAQTPAELVAEVRSFAGCLVVLDLSLSASLGDGRSLLPSLIAAGASVVVLTGATDPVTLGECYELGAHGVVDKAQPVERVVELVASAVDGRSIQVDRRLDVLSDMRAARERRDARQAPFRTLTSKESLVLEHLGHGLVAQEIADVMFVSVSTVRTHIQSVLLKLGVHSQLAAVAMAHERDWLH